jgi:hypothetical protein
MISILCSTVGRAPAETPAREAGPAALSMTARSTLWSLEAPGSNYPPYLVIGMADRRDNPSCGSLRIAGDAATNPSAGNIAGQRGTAASTNRTENIESGSLGSLSLLDPTAEVPGLKRFRADAISACPTIQRSPHLAGANVYRLVDGKSVPGPFLCEYQAHYPPSKNGCRTMNSLRTMYDRHLAPSLN